MTLTQKETTLLEDLKKQEQICIEKYNKYASQASDTKLQSLFSQIGQKEQQHLDTINQILSGTVPSMSSSSGSQGQQSGAQSGMSQQSQSQGMGSSQMQGSNSTGGQSQNMSDTQKNDSYLCTDALTTEKHVSSTYNTSIFEFKDTNIRSVLNHIQKEEQEHGEQIYNYMAQNGMYNA